MELSPEIDPKPKIYEIGELRLLCQTLHRKGFVNYKKKYRSLTQSKHLGEEQGLHLQYDICNPELNGDGNTTALRKEV